MTSMNLIQTAPRPACPLPVEPAPKIAMELRFPCGRSSSLPSWLREVQEMRGRVCYAEGRRPSFLTAAGDFLDADSADHDAFHIIGRAQGSAVGCARLLRLANHPNGMMASTFGERQFDDILKGLGTTRQRVAEASRWMVLPEYRGGLGRNLIAATWAVVRWTGVDGTVALAGTRQFQDAALIRMGAAESLGGPGFLIPTRNASLFRWCLEHGVRVVQPNTLMSMGLYNEPSGAWIPSILY